MTDALQTEDGVRFWMNRTTEAISKNMYVYLSMKDKNITIRVKSISQLRHMKEDIWGHESSKQNRKLLISKKEIFPED